MNSQSAPPSARVSDVDGFSWISDEPVGNMPVRAVSVAEDVVFLGDMGVHSLGGGSRVRISRAEDNEMVSWQERLVHARDFSRSEQDSDARGHRSVSFEDCSQPVAEELELAKGQAGRDGQKVEL